MRFRKQLIVFLSVLAIGGATVGATLAATSSQGDEGGAPETANAEPEAKAYLGVVVRRLTEQAREHLDVPEGLEGAVVVKAQRNSPAAEAELQRGDVILSANEVDVTSPKDLKEIVQGLSPGDEMGMVYYRDGERVQVTVTLAERPAHSGGGLRNRTSNPLRRFLNVFPKAVDGSFRVLGDDGEVRVYEMAQGSITEIGEGSLTIEKATGETAEFEVGDGALIVKMGEEAELADLEEGDRAVVLSVDGEVKAVVVGSPRHRRSDVGRFLRPGNHFGFGADIERLEERFGNLRNRFGFGPDIERLEERFKSLHDRIDGLHSPVEQPQTHPAPPADSTAA